MFSETEKAYVAGIIDGDGNISLIRGMGNRKIAPYIYLQVTVTNTNPKLIEWLKRIPFNGSHRWQRPKEKPTWKNCYRITWSGKLACELLKVIRSYLVIKQERADLALVFYEREESLRQKYGYHFGGRTLAQRLPNEMVISRENYYDQFRVLNARGKHGLRPKTRRSASSR